MVAARPLLAGCALLAALALGGCGGERAARPATTAVAPRPVPVGAGPAFHVPPRGARAAAALPIDGLRCQRRVGRREQAHVELFAAGRVVPIPPGIGVAPPLRRRGAYVRTGRCSYPLRTTEPTGLLELRRDAGLTLGALFDVWGQPLSRRRLARFRGAVRAYLGGVRWRGDPRQLPLRGHAVVVLEVGPFVPPHVSYRFPDHDPEPSS
jgi:hypothetical protein